MGKYYFSSSVTIGIELIRIRMMIIKTMMKMVKALAWMEVLNKEADVGYILQKYTLLRKLRKN